MSCPSELSEGEETMALHLKTQLFEPRREYAFAPSRKFRFDFAFPDQMVAIEVEGGTWKRGRHQTPGGFEDDCEKYNLAAYLGWRVFRYTTAMVKSGKAIDQIMMVMGE